MERYRDPKKDGIFLDKTGVLRKTKKRVEFVTDWECSAKKNMKKIQKENKRKTIKEKGKGTWGKRLNKRRIKGGRRRRVSRYKKSEEWCNEMPPLHAAHYE